MSSSKEVNKVEHVNALVKLTNDKFASVERSNRNLYLQVRDAYDFLSGDLELTKQYENNVKEVHRVTLFLLRTVATDSRLRKFEDRLPESYQTLYELHKFVKEVGETKLEDLVDRKAICKSTTKKDVIELRKQYKPATRKDDEPSTVTTREENEPSTVTTREEDEPSNVATRSLDEFVTEVCSLSYKDRYELANEVLMTLTNDDLELLLTMHAGLSRRLKTSTPQEVAEELGVYEELDNVSEAA